MSLSRSMRDDVQVTVGIDLDTYNSAAATVMGHRPVMLRAREGATQQGLCFLSVVEFDEQGYVVQVGEPARRSMPVYPDRVVSGVKRLIGKAFDQASTAGDIDRFDYRILKGTDGRCQIRVGQQTYSPTEITTLILGKIKEDAEADFNPLGCQVGEAVITVPAYFDPFQKSETERAALAAGFQRVHLMPEPTAAASAYRLQLGQENQYIIVIDLGAGTLDVTAALLFLDDNGQLQTEEKGHGGDTALGGLDMDDAIIQYVVRQNKLAPLLKTPQISARLRFELEKAKMALSTAQSSQVTFAASGADVSFPLTREELETAVAPIIQRCRGPIRVALEEAGLTAHDVSHVLLVGGPTMMPAVRRMVIEEFKSNSQVAGELRAMDEQGFPVDPMEVVARGAVLGTVGRITPHGYGVLLDGEYHEFMPRRQRYLCAGKLGFSCPGHLRTVDFGVIRQAVDPASYREEYLQLGTFQFDYCPQPGRTEFVIEWQYTDNGLLNFRIFQPSTSVHLPLYDVSRLEGQKIRKPASPRPHLDIPSALRDTPSDLSFQDPEPSPGNMHKYSRQKSVDRFSPQRNASGRLWSNVMRSTRVLPSFRQ